MNHPTTPLSALAGAMLLMSGPASATELIVTVTGAPSDEGEIGCALYADAAGFPTDDSAAITVWTPTDAGGAICRFTGAPAGAVAVAVSHDLNGNRETDTNFLGIPTEAWGVSNNVRPSLRAPRFDEAAFTVVDGATTSIAIEIAK